MIDSSLRPNSKNTSGRAPAPRSTAASQPVGEQNLHRIAQVRRNQGISLRAVHRKLGHPVSDLAEQEKETTDLRLSELLAWGDVLEVPIHELLVEPTDDLADPVRRRAQMLKLMKTAVTVKSRAETDSMRRLASRLVGQISELMPELEGVFPWQSVGKRRQSSELGRIAEQPVSTAFLNEDHRTG